MDKVHFSSNKDDWCTPWDFFNKLDSEFHFTLDAAASHANAKCTRYFTAEDDGLSQDWAWETVWVNPPYGRATDRWVEKAYLESRKPETTVVMLLAARTDTKRFHQWIFPHAKEIRWIPGRIKFTNDQGVPADEAPFPSCVVIFKAEDKAP